MTAPRHDGTPAQTISAYVLLTAVPAGVGAIVGRISEQHEQLFAEGPDELGALTEMAITINDQDVLFQVTGSRLDEPGLAAAVEQSPVRAAVQPAVRQHRAYAVIAVTGITDPFTAQRTLTSVVARVLGGDDAVAVYLPHQGRLTTDDLYRHEAAGQPSQTWFWTPAMWLDKAKQTSHVFTAGLAAFGGPEVQYTDVRADPADLFAAFRSALSAIVDEGSLPAAGTEFAVDTVVVRCVPGTDRIRDIDVLDLVPIGAAAPAPKKSRFNPFGRR